MPRQAVDLDSLGTIAGYIEQLYQAEGAVYWLLSDHPQYPGKSMAWMLLNDEADLVLRELEMLATGDSA